jgi:hypothetical protein
LGDRVIGGWGETEIREIRKSGHQDIKRLGDKEIRRQEIRRSEYQEIGR